MKTPSNEYELLHQFEVIFRDGEHKTQAATRDYSKVWESIIDNPPAEGVTPIHVYRLNGEICAVIAGMDELVENEECAMEIARLAAAMQRERECREKLMAALEPFANLARQHDRQPLRGVVDQFYGIHCGTEFEAGLTFTDCRNALAALAAAKELDK